MLCAHVPASACPSGSASVQACSMPQSLCCMPQSLCSRGRPHQGLPHLCADPLMQVRAGAVLAQMRAQDGLHVPLPEALARALRGEAPLKPPPQKRLRAASPAAVATSAPRAEAAVAAEPASPPALVPPTERDPPATAPEASLRASEKPAPDAEAQPEQHAAASARTAAGEEVGVPHQVAPPMLDDADPSASAAVDSGTVPPQAPSDGAPQAAAAAAAPAAAALQSTAEKSPAEAAVAAPAAQEVPVAAAQEGGSASGELATWQTTAKRSPQKSTPATVCPSNLSLPSAPTCPVRLDDSSGERHRCRPAVAKARSNGAPPPRRRRRRPCCPTPATATCMRSNAMSTLCAPRCPRSCSAPSLLLAPSCQAVWPPLWRHWLLPQMRTRWRSSRPTPRCAPASLSCAFLAFAHDADAPACAIVVRPLL